MGLEIDRSEFDDEDYERFDERLAASLEVLRELLERPGMGAGPASIGAELEVSLVAPDGRPAPCNDEVLADSADPRLTVEIDRFNLESNLRHGPLAGEPFAALETQMQQVLAEMSRAASRHDARVAMIGILPTLEAHDLDSAAMTEAPRYRALSASLRRLRREPFSLDIHGEDALELRCHDVTYEGAATSLQLHLRVDPREFARVYNAIQFTTPIVLAAACNSPTFLGRRLWDETRVALFKQAVDHRPDRGRSGKQARVSFGEHWIHGPLELFRENVEHHAALLPVLDTEDPRAALRDGRIPALRELRLHQGTVWRWNRAIYDPAEGGHVRVEMRSLPTGPTVADMLANAAFHIGLALELAPDFEAWTSALAFADVHRDFYEAARSGLRARIAWPEAPGAPATQRPAPEWIDALLPLAQAGLDRAGVARADSEPRLAIIERRARSGQTGAVWQRRALANAEASRSRAEALAAMFARYLELSDAAGPVAGWPAFGA